MPKKISHSILAFIFVFSLEAPVARATPLLGLPEPGSMVSLSSVYQPTIIKGLTIDANNPFLFDFIVDVGQDHIAGEPLKAESEKLIKYFLAALAIPSKDIWVNLSPYEQGRTVPPALAQTDMGRDLLAQDYMLKQLTASLIYPEKAIGKKFWDEVYAKVGALYGSTQLPVNTFNKVWIVPDRAEVFEHKNSAIVTESHLKVMLEEDYLALHKNTAAGLLPNKESRTSQIIRDVVLPEIEQEINSGKNFAQLRQIVHSMILANWYKKRLKQAILNQVYADQSKVKGIDVADQTFVEKIFDRYLRAYKKGVFNYVKEEQGVGGGRVPKKYFSGGFTTRGGPLDTALVSITDDVAKASRAMIGADNQQLRMVNAGFEQEPQETTLDQAMSDNADDEKDKENGKTTRINNGTTEATKRKGLGALLHLPVWGNKDSPKIPEIVSEKKENVPRPRIHYTYEERDEHGKKRVVTLRVEQEVGNINVNGPKGSFSMGKSKGFNLTNVIAGSALLFSLGTVVYLTYQQWTELTSQSQSGAQGFIQAVPEPSGKNRTYKLAEDLTKESVTAYIASAKSLSEGDKESLKNLILFPVNPKMSVPSRRGQRPDLPMSGWQDALDFYWAVVVSANNGSEDAKDLAEDILEGLADPKRKVDPRFKRFFREMRKTSTLKLKRDRAAIVKEILTNEFGDQAKAISLRDADHALVANIPYSQKGIEILEQLRVGDDLYAFTPNLDPGQIIVEFRMSKIAASVATVVLATMIDANKPAEVRKDNTTGGIDLHKLDTGLKMRKDGQGVQMSIDPAMLERIKREGINSLTPVIYRISPISNIWPAIGMEQPPQNDVLAGV